MKKTRLYERHVELDARLVEFGGWLLPVQYPAGPIEEHLNVRKAAGLFDIDHMGQLDVSGPDALAYLQKVLTTDVSTMKMGEARYSLVCYADGGIVDDVFVYRLEGHYYVVVNASNLEKDFRWFKYNMCGHDVQVENVSEETYMLALQGPRAEEILQQVASVDLGNMAYHTGVEAKVAGIAMIIGRTGYTGEDGFELFFPADRACEMWDKLMELGQPLGMLPIGLAARDSLRFEACMPLYGQEIAADLDPISAGFGWAVSFDKGDFVGREALLKIKLEGPEQRLVAFEMKDRGVPRHDYVTTVGGEEVGRVTTGMYAPFVGKYVGLAYLPVGSAIPGTEFGVLIRGKVRKAVVVNKPFYVPAYRR